jgi:hypothetical protein
MVQVDDLIEPRLEKIALPVIAPLPWPHRITLHRADGGRESHPKPTFNLQEIKPIKPTFLQAQILAEPRKRRRNKGVQDISRTTTSSMRPTPQAEGAGRRNGTISYG